MQPIQSTLQKRLNQHNLTGQAQAAMVVRFANEYLISHQQFDPVQVSATVLKKAVLWVEVANPILGQQVWGSSMEMLHLIHQKYPEIKVSQIRTKALTQP